MTSRSTINASAATSLVSQLLAATALGLAACAPTPQAAPSDAPAASAARSVADDLPSTSTPPVPAAAPSASSARVASSAVSGTSLPNCAEADISLDLRAWPTNHTVDVARESVYEASKFRGDAPVGATVEVYPKTSYGFVARLMAETEAKAFDRCTAVVAAYLPGAPTRHPLDHSPFVVKCRPCGKGTPDGTQGRLE